MLDETDWLPNRYISENWRLECAQHYAKCLQMQCCNRKWIMCTKEMKRKEEEGKSSHLIGSVSLFLLHQRSACKGRQYETLKNYKQYCNDRNCERPAMAGALEGCHWEGELGVSWIEEVNPNKWWVLCGRGEHVLYLLVSLNPANWFIMTLGRVMYRKTLHRPINLQTEGCDLIDLRRL